MLPQLSAFFNTSLAALWAAAADLCLPALIFAAIALAARGAAAIATARNAAGEIRTNVILNIIDIIFIGPLVALSVGAAGAWLQRSGLALLDPAQWRAPPLWAVVVIAIFIGDFIGYWRHRLEHTPLLWPAHAIHHSDTRMTWTTLFRFHPINRLSTAVIDTSALALLGFPPEALIANNLVRHYYGMFIHMDLPWTYGALGRIFVSPAMHRWHHVRDGAGANFATIFSVFDQAFRTYHVPGPCTAPLGVRDEIGQGALAQLIWPFRVLGQNILGAFARPPTQERLNMDDAFAVVALYTGLNAILLVVLAINTGIRRAPQNAIEPGAMGDGALTRAIRAHANFTENAPLALLLLIALALTTTAPLPIHIFGATFTFARVLHAIGMMQTKHPNALRLAGMF